MCSSQWAYSVGSFNFGRRYFEGFTALGCLSQVETDTETTTLKLPLMCLGADVNLGLHTWQNSVPSKLAVLLALLSWFNRRIILASEMSMSRLYNPEEKRCGQKPALTPSLLSHLPTAIACKGKATVDFHLHTGFENRDRSNSLLISASFTEPYIHCHVVSG